MSASTERYCAICGYRIVPTGASWTHEYGELRCPEGFGATATATL